MSSQRTLRAAHEPRIVPPTAPKEEKIKFGSSNTWSQEELEPFNVHFEMKRRLDLNETVLKVNGSEWSPEIRARMTCFTSLLFLKWVGIANGTKQLASIDITHLKHGTVAINKARKQFAPDFGTFFSSLVEVITAQEQKQRAKEASQSVSTPISPGSTIP